MQYKVQALLLTDLPDNFLRTVADSHDATAVKQNPLASEADGIFFVTDELD